MVKLDYNQARKVHKLIRKECCNCVDGNCVLLDDGRCTFSTQQ
ncbi:MAG: cysteine-rich VLP protein [Clostridia bacterium]|nr:cysteine-rich VLP protein [Clostridia bacterium]